MAFTAFTYGDPKVSQAELFAVATLFGLSFTGTNPIPTIAAENIAGGVVGAAYSEALTVVGGTAPFTWTVLSGTLPSGTALTSALISGTLTTAGTFSFTIGVTDSIGVSGSQNFKSIVTSGGGGAVSNFGYAY